MDYIKKVTRNVKISSKNKKERENNFERLSNISFMKIFLTDNYVLLVKNFSKTFF